MSFRDLLPGPWRSGQSSHSLNDTKGHFSTALEDFVSSLPAEKIDLNAINKAMGQRSIAALLLVLVLPAAMPIPVPVFSTIFGVPLVWVSAQLLAGHRQAWLPSSIGQQSVPRAEFAAFVSKALPILRFLERMIRPRQQWLAAEAATRLVGLTCVVLAILIILPIPLGHVIPGIAIVLMALGLIERDGVAVVLGLLVGFFALGVVGFALGQILSQLQNWTSDWIPL